MKSLAYFLVFSILISFALSNEVSSDLSTDSKPCDSTCLQCQETVYALKFHGTADCGYSHCKNTVFIYITIFSVLKLKKHGKDQIPHLLLL